MIRDPFDFFFPTVLFALIVGGIWLIVHLVLADEREWSAFSEAHKCRAVAHVKGDVFNTIGFDSKGGAVIGIGSTPDKTGYLCDDGVTYYR